MRSLIKNSHSLDLDNSSDAAWGPFVADDPGPKVPVAPALQVIVSWGASVLMVAHVDPKQGFALGSPRSSDESVQFPADPALLGSSYVQLILVDELDSVFVVIPEQASSSITRAKRQSREQLLPADANTSGGLKRERLHQLGNDCVVELALPGLNISLSLAPRLNVFPRGWDSFDREAPIYFAASAGVFACLMGAFAFFVPPLGQGDETQLDRERLFLISQYLNAASEREREHEELQASSSGQADGASGKRAEGREGEAGQVEQAKRDKRTTIQGPRNNTQLQLSRAELLAEAVQSGMIGLLNSDLRADAGLANPIFGRDETLGNADLTAQGNLWGDEPGESGGWGGLGLAGDGFGGGELYGNGIGIGLGRVGTIGLGLGKSGLGQGRGTLPTGHGSKAPTMRAGATVLTGRLPAEVIQRIVRQNFGHFRLCYEQGLTKNPRLEGRVSVRFVIGNDGAVSAVSAAGDLADQTMKSCLTGAFYGLSFPAPSGGIVTVTYPLMFQPQ